MSELAVNKALKVVIENSVIPALEAANKELEKYKILYTNALDIVIQLDPDNHDGDEVVCYECMRLVEYENTDKCYVCVGNICFDCIPKFTRRVCKICDGIIHLKCDDKSYSCNRCECCLSCCKCEHNKHIA